MLLDDFMIIIGVHEEVDARLKLYGSVVLHFRVC